MAYYRKVAIEMDELDRLERLDRRMTIMDLEMDEESVIISEATGRKVSLSVSFSGRLTA